MAKPGIGAIAGQLATKAGSAGAKAASGASGLGSAASSAGGAVKGAVWGAGAAAGGQVVNAIGDPGFILFIGGLVTFFFQGFVNNTTLTILIGTIFMFYSSIFIFKARGIVLTTLFWVWYIFYGASMNPDILFYAMAPALFIGMVVHGLYSKLSKKGSFAGGSSGELIGLVPVLFFFLNLGLIALLQKTFFITLNPLVKNLVLFTPWWAILGIFATKKENFLITISKFVAIIYIISILTFGVVPDAYSTAESALPGPQELIDAQKQIESQLPDAENPAYSNFVCSWSEGFTGDISGCVKKRQESSVIKSTCLNKDIKEGSNEFNDCIKQEQEKQKDQAYSVSGDIDPNIDKPTRATLTIDTKSISQFYSPGAYSITTDFKLDNPRNQKLEIDVICKFISKGSYKNVDGKIRGVDDKIQIDGEYENSFDCEPSVALEGERYDFEIIATLKDLNSKARLERAFIGNKSVKEIEELKKTQITQKIRDGKSKSPADLARINFDLGHTKENIIIEDSIYKNILLRSNIQNIGSGKISAIKSYNINLEGFTTDNENCRQGPTENQFTVKQLEQRTIALPVCSITGIPLELKDPQEFSNQPWVPKTFIAEFTYDYQLTAKKTLTIKQ
ncbi:hypothetical protein HQ489_02740 [Candidatus Woesearchaeota archaeon]|nr:hypothetical protein [Candidatus Woesearchaeota archaeon]